MSQDHGGPDRLPPQSREAERSVLGSMLRDNGVIGDVIQIVHTDSFYLDAHQKIFDAMTKGLYDKGHPVDLVTLANLLQERKHIEDIGNYAYLAELWDAAPTAANAEYYARIVRDKAIVRHLIHAGTEILRDAYDQAQPADEMLEGAERKILDIAQMGVTGQTYTLEEALRQAYDRIDTRHQQDEFAISGLSTGYVDLDDKTAGLQNSELIILAARPSVGKTAFSLNIVRHIAVEDHHPVFFVSLEQSRIELAERLLCCQARVDSHRLRKGTLNPDDMQKLIEPDNRRDPRQEQVAQISRRLKFLARELQIPVMALAQVNRSSEDRQDHRPRLADLRESGCLAGETLVTLADTGGRVPIRDLVGRSGFRVWALDEVSMKLKPAEVSNAFCTGCKPVYRLETRLGRVIRATANHKFRTLKEWKRLDELQIGECIALPRVIPCGTRTTITPTEAGLLGHLIGDGCTLPRHAIQYTTREEDLAQLVSDLGRQVFGDRVEPRIRRERQWYQVYLSASEHLTHGRRNPVAEWLDRLRVFGLRSYEKYVPEEMFEQNADTIATFLRHLWATDGCIRPPQKSCRHPSIYYASSSEALARDVQSLLLRMGIDAVLRSRPQGDKGRTQFHVLIMGHEDILTFADRVGAVGSYKSEALAECRTWISGRPANTNRDVVPNALWREFAVPAMRRNQVTMRQMQHSLGMAFMGSGLYKQNVSRERLGRVATAVGGDEHLAALARSEVYWDRVLSITPDGEEEVYDLTVPGPANFISGDFLSHNSIEQDADTVMLLHRPELYEPGQHEGIIEVIIGKQRNGPTGEVTLTYLKQYMRYENFAVASPFGGIDH